MSRAKSYRILEVFADVDEGMVRAQRVHLKDKYKGQPDVQVCFGSRDVRAFLAFATVYIVVARRVQS